MFSVYHLKKFLIYLHATQIEAAYSISVNATISTIVVKSKPK